MKEAIKEMGEMTANGKRPMKIALVGTRGVPARYGGFETAAEELGKRLAARGHEVLVYSRRSYYRTKLRAYEGMRIIYSPGVRQKALDTLSHTFFSLIQAKRERPDVFLVFNAANGPLLFLTRFSREKVVVNLDGLEWTRGKWGFWGRRFFLLAARMAVALADSAVADSRAVQEFYRKRWGKETIYIPYGAEVRFSRNPSLLRRFDLSPREYFLQITRFEPENNPLLTVTAFEKINAAKKLVLVGGAKYPSSYSRRVYATSDKRIIFPGFIYDKDILSELLTNCFAYIHGNEAGGTNPALLEAMGCGCFVIARDVVFNREVLQQMGLFYKKEEDDLRLKLEWAIENSHRLEAFRESAREIVARKYRWDEVVNAYEKLLRRVCLSRTK